MGLYIIYTLIIPRFMTLAWTAPLNFRFTYPNTYSITSLRCLRGISYFTCPDLSSWSSLSNIVLLKSSPFQRMSTPFFQGPQLTSFILWYHACNLSASCTATIWGWTPRLPVLLQTTIISLMDYCNNLTDLLALPYVCLFTIFSQCSIPLLKNNNNNKWSHQYPIIANISVTGKPKSLARPARPLMIWSPRLLWSHILLCPKSALFTPSWHMGLFIAPGTCQPARSHPRTFVLIILLPASLFPQWFEWLNPLSPSGVFLNATN